VARCSAIFQQLQLKTAMLSFVFDESAERLRKVASACGSNIHEWYMCLHPATLHKNSLSRRAFLMCTSWFASTQHRDNPMLRQSGHEARRFVETSLL
jgi:hypothetical protein